MNPHPLVDPGAPLKLHVGVYAVQAAGLSVGLQPEGARMLYPYV